ncbi:hypothetical protein [Corynebacterium halotolerans]|uniref:8-oxoguanine DNA glycosylase OGG fold protein n=1 Tax=Corynebacterium halotolerans TaxID=225326 RepID=UPI003CE8D907
MANTPNLTPPPWLRDRLDGASVTPDIFHQGGWVNRRAMEDELREHEFEPRLIGDWISRAQLFEYADWARESQEGALQLLFNTMAWAEGKANRNNRRRVRAIARDRERAGELLQTAAQLSGTDAESAYNRLLTGVRTPAISTISPTVFTKFLYFCGAGRPNHPALMLDRAVAEALREAGWRDFRTQNWSGAEYVAYLNLVTRWRDELSGDFPRLRTDLVEWALRR